MTGAWKERHTAEGIDPAVDFYLLVAHFGVQIILMPFLANSVKIFENLLAGIKSLQFGVTD